MVAKFDKMDKRDMNKNIEYHKLTINFSIIFRFYLAGLIIMLEKVI